MCAGEKGRTDPPLFNLHADHYSHRVVVLAPDFVFIQREHKIIRPCTIRDAFGPSWALGFAHPNPGQVSISREGKDISVSGPVCFYLPAFSLVQWRLAPGILKWMAFMSEKKLPLGLPQEAVYFPWDGKQFPDSVEEIIGMIQKAPSKILIEKIEKKSDTASRLKREIERTYTTETKIADIARHWGVSRVAMGRAFKEAYGLTPLEYRNQLRIFYSLRLLRQGHDVTSAGLESGFGHVSQFNRQFAKHLSVNPLEYCLSKKNISIDETQVDQIQGGISTWQSHSSQVEQVS